MPVEYREDPEIAKMVEDLIASPKLPDLKLLTKHNVGVLVVVSDRTNNQGETQAAKTDPVKLKKISEAERLFIRDNAYYLMVVDAGYWADCNDKRRKGLLAEALYTIEVEGDEATGLPKFKKRAFDYQGFTPVTVAFGPPTEHQRESLEVVSENLFGMIRAAATEAANRVVPTAAPAPAPKPSPKAVKKAEPEPEPEPEAPADDSGPTPEVEDAPAPPPRRITPKGFVTRPNKPNRSAPPEPEPEPEPAAEEEPPRVRAVSVPTRRTHQ